MKKTTRFLAILLLILLMPLAVQAQDIYQPRSHPDCFSGNLKHYEGKWILDGYGYQTSPWILEISDGKYTLYDCFDEVVYKGDVDFKPGYGPDTGVDTLVLPLADGMELVLINAAGGLVDVSKQNLNFVKSANRLNSIVADFELHTRRHDGDWVLIGWFGYLKYSYVQNSPTRFR